MLERVVIRNTMFVLIKSRKSSKMGHSGSKTRSQGKILEKPHVCFRGHIFNPIIMKLGQYFYLDEIPNKFWMGHIRSKTRSLGQILEKFVYALEATF